MGRAVHVRNLRDGEAANLPPDLQNHGMPYLVPEWAWVVEPVSPLGPFGPPARPFALIVASFSHGWLVLWRILAISPLPSGIPLNWIMEALPRVFADARPRGCVGFMTMLSDNKPAEVKMARIVQRLWYGKLEPFQGSIAAGMLPEIADTARAEQMQKEEAA